MRRLAPPVFLALLAACSVTTTGAPCSSDLNCPSDQGCGSDGTCSTAALSCAGHTEAGQCVPGTTCASGEVVTCTATTGVCSTRTAQACADPGQGCVASGGGAACACPVANACTQLDATRCSAAADEVLRCRPVAAGSACLTWQTETSCASGGLVCSASACVCPVNAGSVYYADAVSGSPIGSTPAPTGAASPAACRFSTLTDALAAANTRGVGSTAKATGWSAAVPGGSVVFSEAGALTIGAGVALTTDDSPLTTSHYVVTTPAALPGPFVSIGPGGALSGFEVRNVASPGAGVQTVCARPTDTAPVSLSTVRIAAAAGTPAVRFASGLHVTGACGIAATNLTVISAATGVLVESSSPSVESTVSVPGITGSTTAGLTLIEGKVTFVGGSIDGNAAGALVGTAGAGAPSFTATGTTFSENAGDGVYVGRGTLTSDGCSFSRNGTHVRAEPVLVGVAINVSVRNSAGAKRMTLANNSAIRLLALGSGSTLLLKDNEITGNGATDSYPLGASSRRGGGIVWLAPFPAAGNITFQGNTIASNDWDQVLVAASSGTLNLAGDSSCGGLSNTFACYSSSYPAGQPQGVGLYSNGAAVTVDWNLWMNQPAQMGVDVVGTGVSGFANACPQVTICP